MLVIGALVFWHVAPAFACVPILGWSIDAKEETRTYGMGELRHAFMSRFEGLKRLADALADGQRSHRTAASLIVGYVWLWWLYAIIAKGSQDIQFDMGEVVSWSLIPAFGYPKHPPFPAWVAAVWFRSFPTRMGLLFSPRSLASGPRSGSPG